MARHHWRAMVVGCLLALLLAAAVPASPVRAAGGWRAVVVRGEGAAAALARAGGQALAGLPIVGGVLGRVPAGRVAAVAAAPGVRGVTDAGRRLRLSGGAADAAPAGAPPRAGGGRPAARGGAGVAVGLLDTGIAPVDDLAGRVVARADLSGEHSFTDAYGHGTFMAGLIAGTGRDGGPAGAAPGASLVDLRVAGADGSTTLAQVLRGLQLADANRATLHLAVLNLSLSVPADDPAAAPLTEAVERLWADGVTVVAAAGNDGHGVAAPGLDPYVVTAGALDPATGTVPAWSGRGRDFAGRSKPDLLAPGVGVVGPRAAGSTVDAAHPSARVGRAYLRGSGTSMATAVVSGVAARLAAAHPGWGPDEIKAALLAGADRPGGGPGVVDLAGALAVWRAAPANADLYRLRPAAAAATATSWATGQWLARSDAARSWQRHGLAAGTAAPAWAARQWAWGGAAAPPWAGREWAGREWAGREWAGREWAVHGWGAG